ncbi:MAG: hypothetical protein ACQEUZ_00750 [Pseudomonadota bacterium]
MAREAAMSEWKRELEGEVKALRRLLAAAPGLASGAGGAGAARAIPRRVRQLFLGPGQGPEPLRRAAAARPLSAFELSRLRSRGGVDPEAQAAADAMRRQGQGLRVSRQDLMLLDGLAVGRTRLCAAMDGLARGLSGAAADDPGLRRDANFLAGRLEELEQAVREAEARLKAAPAGGRARPAAAARRPGVGRAG